MLEELFLTVLEVSLGVSAVILLMLLTAGATGKRFSAKWRYWIWLVLALRMAVPINLALPQAPVAFAVPARQVVLTREDTAEPLLQQTLPGEAAENTADIRPQAAPDTPAENTADTRPQTAPDTQIQSETVPVKEYTFSLLTALSLLWAGGAVLSLCWQGAAYLRFWRRLAPWNEELSGDPAHDELMLLCREMNYGGKVKLCRNKLIKSPMMTGFFQPMILLPALPISGEDLAIVLRHELTHCRRHDLWIKLLLVLARCLHWFNPFAWLMLREADRDLEITCDETVVRNTTPEFRQSYCEAILRLMRGGMNRGALLSTSFFGGKKVLKRRFTTVLNSRIRRGRVIFTVMFIAVICSATLLGCTYGSAAPVQEEQEVPTEQPPVVTGPDENGHFPAISEEDFERWVTYGEPDTVCPDSAAITPFMETKSCTDWLSQQYPDISDWQVLYEYDTHTLRQGCYDPYLYQWRDQYLPNRVTVLSTEQSPDFDRLVLVSIEEYTVVVNGEYMPRYETLIYSSAGWESTLQMGDLAGAQSIFTDGNDWYPSLWLPKRQRAFLLDFNRGNILPVANAVEEPPALYDNYDIYGYTLGERGEGDRFVACGKESTVNYYYDAQTQSLWPFLGCTGENPQLYQMDDTTLAIRCEDAVWLYNLDSDTPTSPIAAIGGNGQGLDEGEVWIMYQIANDRSNADHHTFLYYTKAVREWRVCTFTSNGKILSDFSTGLPVIEDYIGSTTYAEGLVYFVYYSGGSGNGSSRRQYCIDARPGYDHILQRYE